MRVRTYHKKKRRGRAGFMILTLICALIVIWGISDLVFDSLYRTEAEEQAEEDSGQAEEAPVKKYQIAHDLPVNSSNAILIRADNGDVLFDKNGEERIYPASMSKIMTAIVALENLRDLNEYIALNAEMYSRLYNAHASLAGFAAGERVRAIDLLYGLMLPSGAECGIGLADHIAGSESAFVDLMNDKALELGMNGTHFVNTSGLHDPQHYSTVSDMALLLRYALNNSVFYDIFTSAGHSVPPTNKQEEGLTFYSTLFANIDTPDFPDGFILGGKTGYTEEAGQCLASLAEKDGTRFILVTCGAYGDHRTRKLHIDDAFAVYAAIEPAD
jgi:D-alanyl-D-alanine carboxypeptidase (penicillin-binding protein 5/6)